MPQGQLCTGFARATLSDPRYTSLLLRMPAPEAPDISIVVPTLREAANIPVLVERLASAMAGRSCEILIVDDDSRDGSEEVVVKLAGTHPVRILVRRPPKDGLSGAVLDGFRAARGKFLVCMDADLQHPPEKVPELVDALASAPFALGSRYTAGGGIDGKWSLFRALNSRVATTLARPFAPGITDPMSGFFALSRSTLDAAERLTPLGYKIALELMCKCRVAESGGVREVPIHFAQRERGQSKLTAREQFRYLEHLSRLYDYTFPRASPVAKFLISLALGWIPAALVYVLLPAEPFLRFAFAYPFVIAVTALLHRRYVRAQREFIVRKRPWADFWLISLAEYVAALLAAGYLQSRNIASTHPREFLAITLAIAAATRYALRKELLHDIRGLRRDPRQFQ